MSNTAALIMALGIVAGDTAIVLACQFVRREPFTTIDRWLATAWAAIYKWTGGAALDRAINQRRDARDVRGFHAMADCLDAAGMADAASRCRGTATRIRARSL